MNEEPKATITIAAPGYYFSGYFDLIRIQKMVDVCCECIREQHAENMANKILPETKPENKTA